MSTLSRSTAGLTLALSALALAVLAACSSVPTTNARLEQARSANASAQASPQAREGAAAELKLAAEALAAADAAQARGDSLATVDHLAYLASQRAALAEQVGGRKAAESAVAQSGAERDRLRLAARTQEADTATRSAQAAQADAKTAQSQAQSAERDARASQRQSAASQQQAGAAELRSAELEGQLRDMSARKTDRGVVVTLGDVLFDTGRAELKSGGMRNVDKLATFLKDHPQRKAMVEGFTDSVGSDELNQALSARRADAVRSALVTRGIEADRIGAQGYGEGFPVAGNESAGGRQMNRRVEIVLSDDGGSVAPR